MLPIYLRNFFSIFAIFILLSICMVVVVLGMIITFGQAKSLLTSRVGRLLGRLALYTSGIKLNLIHCGEQHKGPAVYIANHSSIIDLFVVLALGIPDIRFILKREFLYNPFFGIMGLLTGQVFINRQNSEQAIATLNRAYNRIRHQQLSLLVMPEGTRSVNGKISPFKKGAFRMAVDLGYPIVPMHFIGLHKLSSGKTLISRPGNITVKVYPAVETSSWDVEKMEEKIENLRQTYIRWEKEEQA